MTIASLIPSDLKAFLQKIEALGFSLCLVGGAPRDFLLKNILVHDLDFEIRNLDISVLSKYLKANQIKYEELPYQILRVKAGDFDLEFSTPREEIALLNNKTHHHFKAVLNPRLSYKEAFKRRDFTINAIGIELNMAAEKESLIDPYNGVMDLKHKVLNNISDDFFFDSVRFLRLIRFAIKYDFHIGEVIQKELSRFDLSELSIYHFNEEMMKSQKPGLFINRFNELVLQNNIMLSSDFLFLKNQTYPQTIKKREDILFFNFFNHKEQLDHVMKVFSIPEKKLKDLKSFNSSWEALKKTNRQDLMAMAKIPFDQISAPGILSDMKNLEDKKEWREYFSDDLLIGWDDWKEEIVQLKTLEEITPSMRSFYRYYLTVRRKFLA